MPLHIYVCDECRYRKKHYIGSSDAGPKECPSCTSVKYVRQLGRITLDIKYSTIEEIMEKDIDPYVREVHARIGKETMEHSVTQLEDLYGVQAIESVLNPSDGWSSQDIEDIEKITKK